MSNVQRSIELFEALGFSFNPQFTDAWATCMLVGSDLASGILNSILKEAGLKP